MRRSETYLGKARAFGRTTRESMPLGERKDLAVCNQPANGPCISHEKLRPDHSGSRVLWRNETFPSESVSGPAVSLGMPLKWPRPFSSRGAAWRISQFPGTTNVSRQCRPMPALTIDTVCSSYLTSYYQDLDPRLVAGCAFFWE